MTMKDNVIKFNKPESSTQDFLTDLARQGAQQMIAAAIEAEVQAFIANHPSALTNNGLKQYVRNGYLPQRQIQTGIGEIPVTVPRVRDRLPEIDGIMLE